MTEPTVLQFRITLQDIRPLVWRRIQVLDNATFWDLHVAIQDAMGWSDAHLHEFRVVSLDGSEDEYIGIPDDWDSKVHPVLAGWEVRVRDYLDLKRNHIMSYLYDFGDSWEHCIEFEGEHEKTASRYPICLAGERACPPEDVGGVTGYAHFLAAIRDPSHPEGEALLEWVGGTFDPTKFEAKAVKFSNPKSRWRLAFA